MKELDVLLSRYFDRRYDRAGTAEQAAFARLLAHQDPDLYDLILGSSAAADPEEAHVIDELRQYARA
jgi:antitoxin CptB